MVHSDPTRQARPVHQHDHKPMTVKELIEHLQECNQELPVAICTNDFYGYYSEISKDDVYADTVTARPVMQGQAYSRKFDAMVIRIY
jgi:hypothetical protein